MLKFLQTFLHATGMWMPILIGAAIGQYTCAYAGIAAVVFSWVGIAQLEKWVDDELLGLHSL